MQEPTIAQKDWTLFPFIIQNKVHQPHDAKPGERCGGRIFPLAYAFGWRHFYCMQPCCDHRGQMDDVGQDMGRVHVDCTSDYTHIDILYCLDCGKVGRALEVP